MVNMTTFSRIENRLEMFRFMPQSLKKNRTHTNNWSSTERF